MQEIIKIISEHLDVDQSKITPSSNLIDDLNADWLDIPEIVIACEEKYTIHIEDSVTESIKTVQDLITAVENKK